MIIENVTGKFYAPDTASVLDIKTGMYSLDSTKLVPYAKYLLQEELKVKKQELSILVNTDAELLIWAKENCPDIKQAALIQSDINKLNIDITNFVI